MGDSQTTADSLSQRARYYSSMNYHEYVSVFDKPPSKPTIKPVDTNKEEEIGGFQLESGGDSSKEEISHFAPEVRKPSQSVNFEIGGRIEDMRKAFLEELDGVTGEGKIEENEEEDGFEFSISEIQQEQGYKNRTRSQSENCSSSIFRFLNNRSRQQSLVN